jgi:hypothetical protein
MRKDGIILTGILLLFVGMFLLGHLGVSPNLLRGAALLIYPLIVALLFRRFRRSAPGVPWASHVAATFAVFLGAVALVGGLGHSAAVASLAMREGAYGPLQILRFTTGAMLVYFGAMSVTVYPAIKAGQRWAVGVSAAAGLLFWLYLLFLLPLPGTAGLATGFFGALSVYLPSLGAAAFASRRHSSRWADSAPAPTEHAQA